MKHETELAMQLTRNLVEQFPLGCACFQAVFDENGEIHDYLVLDVNAPFEALSGLNRDAVIGKSIAEAFKLLQPDLLDLLTDLGNESLARNDKSTVLYLSVFSHVYKATLIFVCELIYVVYESVPAQFCHSAPQRPTPLEIIPQRIAEKGSLVFNDPPCGRSDQAKAGDTGKRAVAMSPKTRDFLRKSSAAYYDSLTGLHNRPFAVEALNLHIAQGAMPLSIVLGDVNGLKMINDGLGYKAGDEILASIAQTLRGNCRTEDLVARWSDDEFLLLLPRSTSEEAQAVVKRLREALKKECLSNRCTTMTFGYATIEENVLNAESLVKEAEMWVHRKKLLESQSYRSSIIKLLLSTLHVKSTETQEHSDRIAIHCRKIAAKLDLSDEMINDLVLLAMLHDIGKVGIRNEILNKPGPLTPEERREIEHHPEIGYRITQNIPELSQVAKYILAHHEWWNGKGYPNGLRGEDIPIPSRIIAVVDAYDVMITGRVYQAARSKEAATAELLRCAGTQFDLSIVEILVKMIRDGE